jgi:sugar lactone lactonase YvrE
MGIHRGWFAARNRRIVQCAAMVLVACISATSGAHPGRGIVVDASGNVYVSDAVRSVVWRFTPAGGIESAAREVHAHWLAMDEDGAVLADQVRYDADARQFLRGLVRIDPTLAVTTIIAPRPDPDGLDAGAFTVRDGVLYIARDATGTVEGLRNGNTIWQATLPAASATVNSLGFDARGHVVAVRGRDVLRIAEDGTVKTTRVAPGTTDDRTLGLRDLWGLAIGADGTLYTTDPGRRQLLAIEADGTSRVVHDIAAPWFPTGVSITGNRILVLEHGLEGNTNLGPRVTSLGNGQTPRVLGTVGDMQPRAR